MRVLAVDVGGTKTLAALYEGEPGTFVEVASRRYESHEYSGIVPILADFLERKTVAAAAIGVAGPVIDDACKTTNLPWHLDARGIESELAIPRVRLINDFEAVALGVTELPSSELAVLQERPVDRSAPAAVIGAGTGLGEAIILPSEEGLPRVLPTEGGHADFAPRDDVEIELLRFLRARYGHVSYERVLSGPGLEALYDFVVESGLAATAGATRALLEAADDRAAVIGECALSCADDACVRAVSLFVSVYGAEAGNLALKTLPGAGVFVAGGIAPKLLPIIREGEFLRSFRDKGRMIPVLDPVPVSVVLDPNVGLVGARRVAFSVAG
jgi:glucokinase